MPQVGRQAWHEPVHIQSRSVPGDELPGGEGVAKILKPRAMAAAARLFRAQINVLAQPRERPPHHIAGQTRRVRLFWNDGP